MVQRYIKFAKKNKEMVYIFSVFAHNRLIYVKNKGVLLHLIHHFSCKKRNFVVILQRQKVNRLF